MKILVLALSLAMQAALLAHAESSVPTPTGIGIKAYPRQALAGEKNEALERKGDRKRGERLFALCRSCHLPSTGGRPDGSIPQLAGQHSSVLIKQMADIRVGVRHNPTMYPVAAVLNDPHDLADLGAYLERLCIPPDEVNCAFSPAFVLPWLPRSRFSAVCQASIDLRESSCFEQSFCSPVR